jgi:signal transduction histidine kinase
MEGRMATILVVEDNLPLLYGLRDLLEREGYEVLTARNGMEALEIMAKTRPDLIISDIMMPRMDGYAFYEAVRSKPEWVLIPFIFLTAKGSLEDIIQGKSLGVEDYITKPFDARELLAVVRSRLERAKAIREATEAKVEKLKEQIITALSHELRTPLTYVVGYTELALEDLKSFTPNALQDYLLEVKRGADRLVKLVEDFLLLIQIDTGRAMEQFQRFSEIRSDLADIVGKVVEKYRPLAESKGVRLEYQVTFPVPPVRILEPLFVDALGRLVDNAIKFSLREEKEVAVSLRRGEEFVEIAVKDKGIGIPPEEISNLFERFRQIGRERTEQQGLGLGLAIAHEIISLHGGKIGVESEPGLGSTFTIYLPPAIP